MEKVRLKAIGSNPIPVTLLLRVEYRACTFFKNFLLFYFIILFYFIYLIIYLIIYLFIYFFSKSRYGMIAERVQRNVYISKDDKFSFQKRNK